VSRTRFLCIVAGVSVVLLAGAWLLGGCGKSSRIAIPNGMGAISVPNDGNIYGLSLTNGGKRDPYRITAQPICIIPPGSYQMVDYSVQNLKNPDSGVSGRLTRKFTVTAGKTTELKIGGPFTAQISAKKEGPSLMSLAMTFKDCGGSECMVEASPAPRFQILSQSGEVLQEGAFSYG
jgi:hypothetical protein